jgi:hypothetical protein
MELLRPDKKQELVQDVANLTGKMVLRVKILKVNYKKNSASLEVYYRE